MSSTSAAAFAAAAAALACVFPAATPSANGRPVLKAWVAFFDSGVSTDTFRAARVTRLKAGVYTLLVSDHPDSFNKLNFHLVGPGLNRRTTGPYFGVAEWKVTFRPGTYHYYADAFPQIVRRSFVVY